MIDSSYLHAKKGTIVEPFFYFGKGLSTADDGGRILLAAPFLYSERQLYLRVDGSTKDERVPAGELGAQLFEYMLREKKWPERIPKE